MQDYKLTFYANSLEGCVKCYDDELPIGGDWIVSSNPDDVLEWIDTVGNETLYFKVTADVYEAVLEVYNIYH